MIIAKFCSNCGVSIQAGKRCKPCGELHNRLYAKRQRKVNRLKAVYGLSPEIYADMLEAQKGKCAICKQAPKVGGLHIDHDHTTGAIRGLLCSGCNKALGYFRDDPAIIENAARYLINTRWIEIK